MCFCTLCVLYFSEQLMIFGELYVIRVAVEEKNAHSYIIGQLACFSMVLKVCVPVCWYYNTNMLIPQYQWVGTAVPVITHHVWYCNALR